MLKDWLGIAGLRPPSAHLQGQLSFWRPMGESQHLCVLALLSEHPGAHSYRSGVLLLECEGGQSEDVPWVISELSSKTNVLGYVR